MADEPTTPTPHTAKPRLNVRTGLNNNNNHAPQKDTLGRPPPRRPLMPLNSNLQPSRFAWNEIDATTPLKGGVLPVLNGVGITVDSPDVTSKFHVETVTTSNVTVQQQPTMIGPDSPAITSSTTNDEGCDFSPLPSSPATNGFDMDNANYNNNNCERSFASEYNLLPRSAQSFLPMMSGPDVFIHSPDPVSRFNVRTSAPSSSTAAAANTISKGIAHIRSSLGEGEGIAARAWREPSVLTRGTSKYGSGNNVTMGGRGRSISVDGVQGLEPGLDDSESDNHTLSPPPAHSTITHRQSILLQQQHHRHSTTSINTTTSTLHPTGGHMTETNQSLGLDTENNEINLDQTISPYKTPDYDNAVQKIRNLQNVNGSINDPQYTSSSLSSSSSSTHNHYHQSKGDKNTQWGKLNRSQSTTRLGLGGVGVGTGLASGQGLGLGGGGDGKEEHSMTSSYGLVSTYYADGSPITHNESRSTTSANIPQGAKLFPIAPPSLPVAPPFNTTRSSFFERRSNAGPSCDGNNETTDNAADTTHMSTTITSVGGIATGIVTANSPIASSFVKRGRVYRSLGAKENFAFGSPPSKAAKIVHLKGYSDITATLAAAAISTNNDCNTMTSGAVMESKEGNNDDNSNVDDDGGSAAESLPSSGVNIGFDRMSDTTSTTSDAGVGLGLEGDIVKPRRRRPAPKHPPRQPQEEEVTTTPAQQPQQSYHQPSQLTHESTLAEPKHQELHRAMVDDVHRDQKDKGYRGTLKGSGSSGIGYPETKSSLSVSTSMPSSSSLSSSAKNSILLVDDINGSWLSDEDEGEGSRSSSMSPSDAAEKDDEHPQTSATSNSRTSKSLSTSSSLSEDKFSTLRRRPREQPLHLPSTSDHHHQLDQSKSSFSLTSSSSSSLSQRVGNAITAGCTLSTDKSNLFYQTARDLMFSPGECVNTTTLRGPGGPGKTIPKSISLYSPPDNDGLSPDHGDVMDGGGLDSPFSPDPSPCPCASPGPSPDPVAYDHTYHTDQTEYEDHHCVRGEVREGDDTGRRHPPDDPIHEKTKSMTANWGWSTPTPRGLKGRRDAIMSSQSTLIDDEDNHHHDRHDMNRDDSLSHRSTQIQALALTPVQTKQCTPHTPKINLHSSDNHHNNSNHNSHNSNHQRDNHYNPYAGKDNNNPFSNHREGGRTSVSRNGGVLSPMTPVLDHLTHRNGDNSDTNNVTSDVTDPHSTADFSPGHAVAYNHTLTTLVNNANGDGVELSPVVRKQQNKSEKVRRLRPRDNNHMPITVPVATGPIRRLIPHNLNTGLIRDHEQEEGRGGIKTGLDGMARVHLKSMGEPKGRTKLQGTKVSKPPSVIRISRTIAISSNFGVKNYCSVARKKKKNSVNPFVANGPILESIPESQEVDF